MQTTQQFESANKWFKLTYPTSWQLEVEDGIYTFTNKKDTKWAFQVSAYKMNAKSVPGYSISTDLLHEMESNPSAKIISLSTKKAIYYTKEHDGSIINYWVMGGKRCKALCTFTADLPVNKAEFEKAELVIESMKLQ